MSKKWIAVAGMMVATFAVSTSVFAGAKGKTLSDDGTQSFVKVEEEQTTTPSTSSYRSNCGGGVYDMMMDKNGNLVSKKQFEENLKRAQKEGRISKEDKEFYERMYEYCSGGTTQGRRGC